MENNSDALDAGGAHAVAIGNIPSLERFQTIPNGKSRVIEVWHSSRIPQRPFAPRLMLPTTADPTAQDGRAFLLETSCSAEKAIANSTRLLGSGTPLAATEGGPP